MIQTIYTNTFNKIIRGIEYIRKTILENKEDILNEYENISKILETSKIEVANFTYVKYKKGLLLTIGIDDYSYIQFTFNKDTDETDTFLRVGYICEKLEDIKKDFNANDNGIAVKTYKRFTSSIRIISIKELGSLYIGVKQAVYQADLILDNMYSYISSITENNDEKSSQD